MARSRSHYSQHVGIPNPSRLDLIRDHAFALQLDWFVCNQKSHRRGEHRAERERRCDVMPTIVHKKCSPPAVLDTLSSCRGLPG